MQKGLDNLNLRLCYLLSAEQDVRSDVKIMKRAALKTRQDLSVQEQEKQRQVSINALPVHANWTAIINLF